ncbi:MAG: sucrase ferredoxin [Chloroflexota bacterium]
MGDTVASEKLYCNCVAEERGLAPQRHAGSFDDAVIIETPLPWKKGLFQDADVVSQEVVDLLTVWIDHYKETGEYRHRPLVIAPDPAYSHEGHRRVMFYNRSKGLFTQFDKVEYLVPEEKVGKLVWAWFQKRDILSKFDVYLVPEADSFRDILVCTHGTVDVACAKFGYPLYKYLRETHATDKVRIWRVSHFGGHVFAPTLLDMPTGHYWAYLDKTSVTQVVKRIGDVATVSGKYRGWAGVGHGFEQAAEHTLWQEHGWNWFTIPRIAETIEQEVVAEEDASPTWADVRLRYMLPEQTHAHIFEGRVTVSHTLSTIPSTDAEKEYAYPQYRMIGIAQTDVTD